MQKTILENRQMKFARTARAAEARTGRREMFAVICDSPTTLQAYGI